MMHPTIWSSTENVYEESDSAVLFSWENFNAFVIDYIGTGVFIMHHQLPTRAMNEGHGKQYKPENHNCCLINSVGTKNWGEEERTMESRTLNYMTKEHDCRFLKHRKPAVPNVTGLTVDLLSGEGGLKGLGLFLTHGPTSRNAFDDWG